MGGVISEMPVADDALKVVARGDLKEDSAQAAKL
jgi:hypothetical protein